MAEWPTLEELKQVLNVGSEDWDGDDDSEPSRLEAVRLAAIDKVKYDVGDWDEDVDEPTVRLSRAALRMAELMALRPDAATEPTKDPVYLSHLFGNRKRFGIS